MITGKKKKSQAEIGLLSTAKYLASIANDVPVIKNNLLNINAAHTTFYPAISGKLTSISLQQQGFYNSILNQVSNFVGIFNRFTNNLGGFIDYFKVQMTRGEGLELKISFDNSLQKQTKSLGEFLNKKNMKKLQEVAEIFKSVNDSMREVRETLQEYENLNVFEKMRDVIASQDSKGDIFIKISAGVAIIAGSLMLLNYVNWGSVFKMTTFLGALFTMMYFYQKLTKNSPGLLDLKGRLIYSIVADKLSGLKGASIFINIGIGIAVIAGALTLMSMVKWSAVGMFLATMIGLALVFSKLPAGASNPWNNLLKFGAGMIFVAGALILYSFVSWTAVGQFILTSIALIGILWVYNQVSGKTGGMLGFGAGLIFVFLSLMLFQTMSWVGAFQLIAFVFMLGLAMSLPNLIGGGGAFQSRGMLGFAFGMLIMVLTIEAFNEISWTGALQLITFVAGLGFAMSQFNIAVNPNTFSKLALGIGLLALSIWIASVLVGPAQVSSMGQMLLAFVPFTIIAWSFDKLAIKPEKFIVKAFGIGLGMQMLAFAMLTNGAIGGLSLLVMPFFAASFGILYWAILKPIINMKSKETQKLVGNSKRISSSILILGLGFVIGGTLGGISLPGMLLFAASFQLALRAIIKPLMGLKPKDVINFETNSMYVAVGMTILSIGMALSSVLGGVSLPGMILFAAAFAIFNFAIYKPLSKINVASGLQMLETSGVLALSLVLLSIGMYAVSLVHLNIVDTLVFVGVATLIVGLMYLMAPIAPIVAAAAGTIALLGVAIALTAGALWLVNNIGPVDTTNFHNGVTGIVKTLVTIAPDLLVAIPAAIGLTLLLIPTTIATLTLMGIATLTFSTEAFDNFKQGTLTIIETFNSFDISDVLSASLKSIGMLPVLGMSWLATFVLNSIGSMQISTDGFAPFKTGMQSIIDTYNGFSLKSTLSAAAKSVLLLPVLLTSKLASWLVQSIGGMSIKEKGFSSFKHGVKKIVETFDDFGVIQCGKLALKGAALLPLFASGYLAAKTLGQISKVDIDTAQMQRFGTNIGILTTTMVDAVKQSEEKLTNVGPGLDALVKITNVGKNLTDIMIAFANGTYNEYGVDQHGNIYVKAVRKIDDWDKLGADVGKAFGNILKHLCAPLAVISSDDDMWDFGGVKIKNPFKKGGFFSFGDNNAGIERIQRIGEAFVPLSTVMQNVANIELFKNQKFLDRFNTGLGTTISSLLDTLNAVDQTKYSSNLKSNMNLITKFGDAVDKVSRELNKADKQGNNTGLIRFVEIFADDNVWKKIEKNLKSTNKELKGMVESINKLNIPKSESLAKSLKLLGENNSSKEIKEAIEQFIRLIAEFKDRTEEQNRLFTDSVNKLEAGFTNWSQPATLPGQAPTPQNVNNVGPVRNISSGGPLEVIITGLRNGVKFPVEIEDLGELEDALKELSDNSLQGR